MNDTQTSLTRPDIGALPGPFDWRARELSKDAGAVALSRGCLDELDQLADVLEKNPISTLTLDPSVFSLPNAERDMQLAKHQLSHGPGFVLIDRLPIEDWPIEVTTAIYWLLMKMIGRPVSQKWSGRMIYDVADLTGKPPGNGIRPDVTNAEQNFHTDNSYNICPPEYVCLLCHRPAEEGGISRIVSLANAHNRLLETAPELLARLYQPFTFDRQREHAPDDIKTIDRPVFSQQDGRISGRISIQLIRQGYELKGERLDELGLKALTALYDLLDDRNGYKEFQFQPGQIQIVDNRLITHKRTAFIDGADPKLKRHLIRLWLRDAGRVFYNG